MGRPPLGSAKKSKRIPLNVTDAQYDQIQAKGGTAWVRRTVLAALGTRAPAKTRRQHKPLARTLNEPAPEPTPEDLIKVPWPEIPEPPDLDIPDVAPHRHKRKKVKERWVGGEDIGEWECADPTCGVTLGAFQ